MTKRFDSSFYQQCDGSISEACLTVTGLCLNLAVYLCFVFTLKRRASPLLEQQLMNDNTIYRTAGATQGMSKTPTKPFVFLYPFTGRIAPTLS